MNSADGVFGVSDDQRIVFWNLAAETMLGVSTEQALGRRCYEVLGGRDERGCFTCRRDCTTMQMVRRRHATPARDARVHIGDHEIWIAVSTILVPSRWRHLSVLIHLFHDITRRKEIERSVFAMMSRVDLLVSAPERIASEHLDRGLPCALTRREQAILELLATGASTDDVAEMLAISPATVRNHVHSLLGKMGVHTRLEAVTLALRTGLLPTRG